MVNKASKNKMWGGRFSSDSSKLLQNVNSSIEFDYKLFEVDIEASIAHAQMLSHCKIITKKDSLSIIAGLKRIKIKFKKGNFKLRKELEDIHMNIESELKKDIGDTAGRVHTARSRNDQVATDLRLYMRRKNFEIIDGISLLQKALANKAHDNYKTIMPGYTHMQTAQPITMGHHLLAYVEMFSRDKGRMMDCNERLNESPLGSGALSGTSFPINRKITAKALGFNNPMRNSLDAVSSRDFVLETMSSIAICSVHLSRLAEEIILWLSDGFNFVELPDQLTTGSSIMPQKKNPDLAELVRGKSGRLIGSLITMLVVMKGLPMAYSKDLQEDKEPTFDALDNILLCLQSMTSMIENMIPNIENMNKAASRQFSTATDLADWLVQNLNIPFRSAHKITGEIVSICITKNITLDELDLDILKKFDKRITKDIFNVLNAEKSVSRKVSEGGTSPKNVKKAAVQWLKRLKDEK
ncbi:MAG: argininosuccinate lyase [Hyphomicrobiales bacterium]|nr:argininosuccinate lyase [Hyphomicrobiales bacterium]